MNFIYMKLMAWALGEAMANSDRIKAAVMGAVVIALVQIAGACQVCATILTPAVTTWISAAIGTFVVSIIAALTHRDIAAPGQAVAGAAIDEPVSASIGIK